MQRRALEFHDSKVQNIEKTGLDVRLRLLGYIHASDGEPGEDPGTGWAQDIELLIDGAQLSGSARQGTILIDGTLGINEEVYRGLIPIPFDSLGGIRLELQGSNSSLNIIGERIRVRAVGEPKFVENFPGSRA